MIVLFTLIQENGRNRYGEIQTVLDMSIEEFMTQKYSYLPVITFKRCLTTGAYLRITLRCRVGGGTVKYANIYRAVCAGSIKN